MKKLLFLLLLVPSVAFSADVDLKWMVAANATGYKIQMSTDNGVTWDAGLDVGDVTQHLYLGVPETGVVLFRAVSYNATGQETIRPEAGAWYNFQWVPPGTAGGLGVE